MADDIDIVSDIENAGDSSPVSEPNVQEPDNDIRSLLNNAIKETSEAGTSTENRDPVTGKFVKKAAEPPAAEPPAAEPPAAEPPAAEPPRTQYKDAAEHVEAVLSAIPEASRQGVRDLLSFRDEAFNQYVAKQFSQLEGLKAISDMIAPRAQAWAMEGMQPSQAINQLLAYSDFADKDPAGFIKWFAGQHNMDLANIYDDDDGSDPELRAIGNRLSQLERGFTNEQAQRKEQAQRDDFDARVRSIEAFAVEKDAQGNLLRPHMEAVVDDVMAILPGLVNANPNMPLPHLLQSAYDKAIWANPAIRAKIQEEQRIKDARDKAQRAREAGSSVAGAPSGDIPASKVEYSTVRGALQAAFAEHS